MCVWITVYAPPVTGESAEPGPGRSRLCRQRYVRDAGLHAGPGSPADPGADSAGRAHPARLLSHAAADQARERSVVASGIILSAAPAWRRVAKCYVWNVLERPGGVCTRWAA